MQQLIKSIWLFIWKGSSGNTSTPKQPQTSESQAGKWFSSITELTLYRFIKCHCTDDLSQLKISGNVSHETLESAWGVIYEQFLDGMKDTEGVHKIRLLAKINNLEFTYRLIQLCVQFLCQAYDREIIEILQKHIRVTGEFNPEDQQGYFEDLQVVLNRAQKLLVEIGNKKAEYATLKGKEQKGQDATEKDFDRLIAQVSIYAKFHIDKKVIMVSEFVEYYTSMRENYEALEEQYEKSKR